MTCHCDEGGRDQARYVIHSSSWTCPACGWHNKSAGGRCVSCTYDVGPLESSDHVVAMECFEVQRRRKQWIRWIALGVGAALAGAVIALVTSL